MSRHQVERTDHAVQIRLSGEIDLDTSPEVRKLLLEEVGRGLPLQIDLSAVQLIDSSGVASLLEGYKAAHDAKQDFILVRISEPVMRVFRLARLDTVFRIE